MNLDKEGAVRRIIYDAQRTRSPSLSGYHDVVKALKILELDEGQREAILITLNYHRARGEPWLWLAVKLASQSKKRGVSA